MFGERVGFLKFKADIVDEETKAKVIRMLVLTRKLGLSSALIYTVI